MSLFNKIRETKDIFNREIDNAISKELSAFQRFMVYVDFKVEQKLHGISVPNYFQYEFYRKNQRGRREFACRREMNLIYKYCNDEKIRYITGDKSTFNTKFSQFLGRKWLDVSNSTYEEFYHFVTGLNKFFVKPVDGECGIGTTIIENDISLDYLSMFKKYKDSKVIIEELISQHSEMAEFNKSSVNTIRVVTLRDAYDNISIMAAVLRIGRQGQVADNFHHHGVCAAIDIATGIVMTTAIDHDHNRYIVHPDSGKTIVGFQIPNWEDVLRVVYEAASIMTELRYIGWDIAIGDKGQVIIIEGNSTPDTNVTQITDQVGKWKDYKDIINELKAKNRN